MRAIPIKDNSPLLKEKIETWTEKIIRGPIEVVQDTTEFMDIYHGQVLRLEDQDFFVLGDLREARFGLDEPKYWVKKCIDLKNGQTKIIKLVFNEEFIARIGPLRIRCYRDPQKESAVLDNIDGDQRFMQGYTLYDPKDNPVRIIDFIKGLSLYHHIFDLKMDHEEYFHTVFPKIFKKLLTCLEAIKELHNQGLCHGDIRNDHILIEAKTGLYRWIDFDLTQHYSDFDIWSLGNVLSFCTGKGLKTFHGVKKSGEFSDKIINSLTNEDASAFYNYRIINLKKLFPYIPHTLSHILLHFNVNTTLFYEQMDDLIADYKLALADLPK